MTTISSIKNIVSKTTHDENYKVSESIQDIFTKILVSFKNRPIENDLSFHFSPDLELTKKECLLLESIILHIVDLFIDLSHEFDKAKILFLKNKKKRKTKLTMKLIVDDCSINQKLLGRVGYQARIHAIEYLLKSIGYELKLKQHSDEIILSFK